MRLIRLIIGAFLVTASMAWNTINATAVSSTRAVPANAGQLAPVLTDVQWSGKSVILFGANLIEGSVVVVNGREYGTVASDALPPTRLLVAPKAGKRLLSGDTMLVTLRSPDGAESNQFRTTARLTVTIADNGKKFHLPLRELLFAKMGNDLAWSFESYDNTIIKFAVPTGVGTLIQGLQGRFQGIAPGRTQLSLTGDQWCAIEPPTVIVE